MIYGERLRLRALEKEDLPKFVEWLNDPEVRENLFINHPLSMAEEEQWFGHMMEQPQYERPLCIEVKIEDDHWQLIGNLALMNISNVHRNAELGIMIGDKDYWNKGFGTEAIKVLVNHAFQNLNLHRIYLRVYDTNPRGVRCYEKAGFVHEGTQRDAIFKDGKYIGMHMMSVLSTEWEMNF
ncbi:MAG: GNAT family protein [Anaerolineae bacterium]|jgi:RimJ/RimL family protein N-acetyltransferase|nr:GNAT family protein [Anaerolineae bacterium]